VGNWVRELEIAGIFTLLGINISPQKGTLEDDFLFPQVGYVSSLEATYI